MLIFRLIIHIKVALTYTLYTLSFTDISKKNNTMPAPVSRPKIHRLPKAKRFRRERQLVHTILNGSTTKFLVALGGMTAVLVFAVVVAGQVTLGDGQRTAFLSSPVSDAMASTPVAMSKTIVLKDRNNVIIGQMSKTPETTPVGDVKSTSMIDKRRSRDLLSIVNQH